MGNLNSTTETMVEVPKMSVQLETSVIFKYNNSKYRLEKPLTVQLPCGIHVVCENEFKKQYIARLNFIDAETPSRLNKMPNYRNYYLVSDACTDVPKPSYVEIHTTILPAQTRIIPEIGEPIVLETDTKIQLQRDYEMSILPGTKLKPAFQSVDPLDATKFYPVEKPRKALLASFRTLGFDSMW
jgi:hypothetical protein